MSTAPILNISNVINSPVVAKTSSTDNSSDQSFGQVLSREVNGRSNANGDANSNQSNTSNTTSTSTTSTNTGGKPVKAKSGDNSSQTTDTSSNGTPNTTTASQNESTQMLALVSSVQQNTSAIPNAASNAASVLGADKLAIGQIVGTGTRVPTTPIAALPTSATASSDASDVAADAIASMPSDAAEIAADTAIKPTLPNDEATMPKTNNAASNISNIELSPNNANTLLSPVNSTNQVALDLGAATEKNIQSGLAALNTSSIKTERDIQTTPVIATTVNAAQTIVTGQALSNDPNDKLTPQVGSPGWDQALGQKVVWMVAGGQQNASLTLNPPDLGPMQVVLSVNNSHATVTFTAAQPEVRQALESAIPKLREMLGDAGIQLGQASINSGSAQQQQTSSHSNGQNANSLNNTSDSTDISLAVPRTTAISTGLGLVDTFV